MDAREPRPHNKPAKFITFSTEELALIQRMAAQHKITEKAVVRAGVWALRRAETIAQGPFSIDNPNATATEGFRLAGETIYPWSASSSNDRSPTTIPK